MKMKFFTVIMGLVLFLSGCGSEIKDAKNWPLKEFTFTNEKNEPLGLADLKGKVWVANFIYTYCPDICPPMTSNMLKLQNKAKDEGIKNIEFVSFSVDPKVDTPEVLTQYAEQYHADTSNWHFLTGYEQEEIEKFALDNFKTLVKKPKNEQFVTHQSYFFLVNQEGTVVQVYPGLEDIPIDGIIKDIKTLQ